MPDSSSGARRRRVPAMAPEERRAAIIAATVPLLHEHGLSVSTRQIAAAAGVAEGTLFGVFPDKGALIRAAVVSSFDPEPTVLALREIDPDADLRERLVAALDIMRDRFCRNAALLYALRASAQHLGVEAEQDGRHVRDFFGKLEHARVRTVQALAALIEPDGALLRRSPDAAANLLFMILMTNARSLFASGEGMDNAEIVTLLLDGLLARDEPVHDDGKDRTRC